LSSFHDEPHNIALGTDVDGEWSIIKQVCPACERAIFTLVSEKARGVGAGVPKLKRDYTALVRPKVVNRAPVPSEVPEEFAQDYREACLILQDSPKASAALSRRVLQRILREKANVTHANLANEIQQIIDSGGMPSYLSESIDAVRNIGNFAAQPIKSTCVGEVVETAPGEAEWILDVIESLFDFYFVQPEVLKRKRAALNKKLKDSGKPKIKKS
jgi:hypothetical protein